MSTYADVPEEMAATLHAALEALDPLTTRINELMGSSAPNAAPLAMLTGVLEQLEPSRPWIATLRRTMKELPRTASTEPVRRRVQTQIDFYDMCEGCFTCLREGEEGAR